MKLLKRCILLCTTGRATARISLHVGNNLKNRGVLGVSSSDRDYIVTRWREIRSDSFGILCSLASHTFL